MWLIYDFNWLHLICKQVSIHHCYEQFYTRQPFKKNNFYPCILSINYQETQAWYTVYIVIHIHTQEMDSSINFRDQLIIGIDTVVPTDCEN